MGLDMTAWVRVERPPRDVDFDVSGQDEELHYWRKHPDLHGWMEELYRRKGGKENDFNSVPVVLETDDLDALEKALNEYALPHTEGFFFGASDPDDYPGDHKFIAKAREAIAAGKTVYYTSWW